MSVRVRIPSALRSHIDGLTEVDTEGENVAQVLHNLQGRYPALTPYLYNENGALRPRVNIYVNDEHVRYRQGLQTPVHDGDQVYIVPLVMGG